MSMEQPEKQKNALKSVVDQVMDGIIAQIIYVTLDKPRGIQMMDTVWVYGKLEIEKTESDIGDAGYRIKAEAVEPYVEDENN